ncbi:FkbM family methyltransferase [uncultured Acetobacterium sp.]|uniref:FkbM family methyltransferase n=1 Tax=uncultured Acetobacterium sp. TaxID=217139 RepID=UPI0025FAE03E|nr:FkbM family methyltransferase [uncultured Acetobacterium sp.]
MTTIDTLESLLGDFEKGTLETDSNKLCDLDKKQIILYGAGNIGKRLYKNLKDNGINTICFIDRAKSTDFSGFEVPIYHPEDEMLIKFKSTGYVILSALFTLNTCNEIKLNLKKLGFENIFALHEVNLSTINNGAFYENLFDGSYNKIDVLGKDRGKVVEAFSSFEQEEDKKLYIEYLKAHLTMDFTRFKEPYDVNLQYLAHNIPIKKDYSRFVDCGGFDGDTIRNLVSKQIKIKNLAIFEPQNDLCVKIAEYTRQNSKKFDTVIMFPCGVHARTEKFRFSVPIDAPSSGRFDEAGSEIIQCVAIDDVLQGFKPTFIKMDIEGAEMNALKGAKRSIIANHPQWIGYNKLDNIIVGR